MITDKETCGLNESEIAELEEYGNRCWGSTRWWSTTANLLEMKEFYNKLRIESNERMYKMFYGVE